jgi:hypothetical protein
MRLQVNFLVEYMPRESYSMKLLTICLLLYGGDQRSMRQSRFLVCHVADILRALENKYATRV